jgi:Zn-dependent peptidase ImmA (M78 family)
MKAIHIDTHFDLGFGNSDFGLSLAKSVISRFGTNDVFEIARRLDISITYAKWFPITLGEFDKKNRRITVNENAKIPIEKIIAHELGHYFAQDLKLVDEEKFCDEFAEALTQDI